MIIVIIFVSVLVLVGVVSAVLFGWLWSIFIIVTMIAAVIYVLYVRLSSDSKRDLTVAELYDRRELFD
jgi:divalent metal cation (Fe/Co/Zn/Cd) transporter